MKISIVSKYPIIKEGIISCLNESYNNVVYFKSLDNFIENFVDEDDNLVIITLFIEDLRSIENISLLKNTYSTIKLLIIDFNESKDIFFKLSKLKIDGYLLGTFAKEDINYAIKKIFTDGKFYDRELLYRLVEDEPAASITSNKNPVGAPLTRRELEILSQLSNGLSNYEISINLNISENTVKKHISNIFIKINVKDRTQAIIYAYESGLITKPLFM